jgi:hypothetical protein
LRNYAEESARANDDHAIIIGLIRNPFFFIDRDRIIDHRYRARVSFGIEFHLAIPLNVASLSRNGLSGAEILGEVIPGVIL